MVHHDIFREQLGIKYPNYGHALWEPSPGKLYGAVEVGDVGYIREGKFHRLFNALLPADHASHLKFGVPEYHEPLVPNLSDHIDTGTLGANHYCSPGITVVDSILNSLASKPDDLSEIAFLCRRKQQGAVLFLPVEAKRQDTVARGDFGKWMIGHIDRWFAFAQQLGLGLENMEDIILVTGCHLSRSWINIAFLGCHTDARVSFGVDVSDEGGPEVDIKWRLSPDRIRGAELSRGPNGKNLEEDQCIFIRGFRVTRTFKILPKHLIAAAEPSSDSDESNSEPELKLTSIPAIPKSRDLLQVLLEQIAERMPECDMVLVHDDSLAQIGEICTGNLARESVEQPDMVTRNYRPEIHQILCDSPCDYGQSSKSSPKPTKVAILYEEYQKWGSPTMQHRPRHVVHNHSCASESAPVLPPVHSLSVVAPSAPPLTPSRSTVPAWTNSLRVQPLQSMPWSYSNEDDFVPIPGQSPVAQSMPYHNMLAWPIVRQPPYAWMRGQMQPGTEDTDHQSPLVFSAEHIIPVSHGPGILSQLPMPTALQIAETSSQWSVGQHLVDPLLSAYNEQTGAVLQQSRLQSGYSLPFSRAMVLSGQPVPSASLSSTLSITSESATETCLFANCATTCTRRQDLERHILQHLPRSIYCPQHDCNWGGYRHDMLRKHVTSHHPDITVLEKGGYMIYNAKLLVKQLLNKELTANQAWDAAHLSFQLKAEEMGKLGLWRE